MIHTLSWRLGVSTRLVSGFDSGNLTKECATIGGVARIRPATLDDIPTLVAYRRGMFVDMGVEDGLDEADSAYRKWVRPLMKKGDYHAWIAEEGATPVGSGCLWNQPVRPCPDGHGLSRA